MRRKKKNLVRGLQVEPQYQILQIEIISILWQTVGRITNEMLGVKGLMINHRRLKGSSVSEKFEKLTSAMGVLSISMQTFFFLHLIIHFPFISISDSSLHLKKFGQRPPLEKFNLFCLTTV